MCVCVFVCVFTFSPPLSHFSSSLPSMQSGSASHLQRMGMQWLFLHLNWSLSHFTSQPSYTHKHTETLRDTHTHTHTHTHTRTHTHTLTHPHTHTHTHPHTHTHTQILIHT